MSDKALDPIDGGLILAAEECPIDQFSNLHVFSSHDDAIVRKLTAHGPVLIRGGRGSGKSALLIQAHLKMRAVPSIFSVYMSLRYLPLLQSDGEEYIKIFCEILSNEITNEIALQDLNVGFLPAQDELTLQQSLSNLAQILSKRIVILFDDAAHIGREKPLEVFFDLFRTLSSNTTSCKASIYPGVTKFGVRFDVYNDSTVIDIMRSDVQTDLNYFHDVLKIRYPDLSTPSRFSDRLQPVQFANLLGRAVVGNMRAFILACNRFEGKSKISIPELNSCMLNMATDYYWPLMEEVAPKLGVYEPLIEPATEVFQAIIDHLCRPAKSNTKNVVQDRVTIHKQIIAKYSKIFEILEYLGFASKREASRGMKSGGRGPVYAINLCSLMDGISSKRLTIEMINEWVESRTELAEIHSAGSTFANVIIPDLPEEHGLGILTKQIDVLAKSRAYPYGLTADKIARLKTAGVAKVSDLAAATDARLLEIDTVGKATVKRMRDVTHQAIWM